MKDIILIGAVWCPSCLTMEKLLKKINDERKDLNIIKLDYDMDISKIEELNLKDIEVIPVIVYNDKRLIGEHKKKEIEEFIYE